MPFVRYSRVATVLYMRWYSPWYSPTPILFFNPSITMTHCGCNIEARYAPLSDEQWNEFSGRVMTEACWDVAGRAEDGNRAHFGAKMSMKLGRT